MLISISRAGSSSSWTRRSSKRGSPRTLMAVVADAEDERLAGRPCGRRSREGHGWPGHEASTKQPAG